MRVIVAKYFLQVMKMNVFTGRMHERGKHWIFQVKGESVKEKWPL